ncbi:DUF397 domain-containing protein [Streptomyces griseorubiginosus]|uniref:DUF397 domain-containing protein n=1 Tax=Streptomyces griseorubiginosus TaxID=67304 RepID=UPI0036EABACB
MPVSPETAAEPVWFKSSHSGGNATECVEAAIVQFGVLIRDSKCPKHQHLTVSAPSWTEFLASFNLPHRAVDSEPT